MIKISGKVKRLTTGSKMIFCLYFKKTKYHFWKKDEISFLKPLSVFRFIHFSTCLSRVLNSFELRTLCTCLCIFSLYTFHLLLLSQQASIAMWTILISKSWWWSLKPKRSTSTLHYCKRVITSTAESKRVFFGGFFNHKLHTKNED